MTSAPDTGAAGAADADRRPWVSVALCTCEGAPFIDAQIASVLAQDGVRIELVISDDASTDDTWPLLQAWAARCDAIRLHRNPQRLGLHANLARALSLCRADLIAPCDQDDIWLPGKLARLAAALEGDRLRAYCDSELVGAAGQPLGLRMSDRFGMYSGSGIVPLCFWNSVSSHAMLLRRSVLNTALPFPASFLPDWWLAICAANTGTVAYVPEPLVHYRQHATNQTDVALRRHVRRDSWRIYDERRARLQVMAGLPGPDQAYLQRLSALWTRRADQRWCPQLVLHMARRRQALVRLRRRGGFVTFALQTLAGQRWRPRTVAARP